jgi:predicted nucleic acid-binding protein
VVGEDLHVSSSYVLDTGVIMRHLRDDNRANSLLNYLEYTGEINVSAITYMEIWVRCLPHEEDATMLFFDRVPPVSVDREVAHKAAKLIKQYPQVFGRDNPRGFPDALIAATAWQLGSVLVTLNVRHFAKIPISEINIKAIKQDASDWVNTFKT